MAPVSFMVMYEDESVDVHFSDGSRLQLSSCGSEFVLEKPPPPSAHPLQSSEKVRQRTRFAISSYKALMVDALEFRNRYATRPYLPEELIPADCRRQFFMEVSEVEWPSSNSCCFELGPDGHVMLCSVDGNARLLLSASGEDFSVEFNCRASQNEDQRASSQYQTLAIQHENNQSFGMREPSALQTTAEVTKVSEAKENVQRDLAKPETNDLQCVGYVESSRSRTGEVYLYTQVVQHHSRSCFLPSWRYPLSLAINHWKSHRTESSECMGTEGAEEMEGGRCQPPMPSIHEGQTSSLPAPLPLRCPSPHQHRWRSGSSPVHEEPEQGVATELVKVVWCQGIVYRIISGTIPIIEVYPGDGSVIRSNGVLANYFTHHRARPAPGDTVESTYYLNHLPPDVPGLMYSVCSMVTRASRILQCYNQAKDHHKLPYTHCCWRKATNFFEPMKLVQEVQVSGSGHFVAYSDGSVEVIFLDGVKLQMMWNSSTAPSEPIGMISEYHSEVEQSYSWCQLLMPDGQQQLVQVEASGPYHKYVSLAVEWCQWVHQTALSRGKVSSLDLLHTPTNEPIHSRSVVAELEKIKRFNFILENSNLLRKQGVSPLTCGFRADVSHMAVNECSISEALQKTSKAIKDIDTLLSDRSFSNHSPA